MRKLCLICCIVIVTLSCDKQRVFEQFVTIDNQSWSNKNKLHFNVNINDTISAYNAYVIIRNTGQYEYSNLYLFVTAYSPEGKQVRDTTEILLANDNGKWLGKGSSSFTLKYPYRTNIKFPLKGIYQFDIEQAMWVKDLKHISHVGLRIEKIDRVRN